MKSTVKITAILIFFLGFIFNQQTHGQEKPNYLNFNEIITKLNSASNDEKSLKAINEQLIIDVQKRKVDFILSSEDEMSLRREGANDLLIQTIVENTTEATRQKLKQDLYKIFGTTEDKRDTLKLSKKFIRYFGKSEEDKEVISYLTKVVPNLEADVNRDNINNSYLKFDRALRDRNWEELLEVSAEILIKQPEIVDVPLAVASLGFDETANKKDGKYLNQTLLYAEKAIELLENDKKSVTENYGVLTYSYKTKDFPDGKANALGYMNYIIGYINYFYLNQKDEAIPYFQKSLQYKSKANELVRQLNLAY